MRLNANVMFLIPAAQRQKKGFTATSESGYVLGSDQKFKPVGNEVGHFEDEDSTLGYQAQVTAMLMHKTDLTILITHSSGRRIRATPCTQKKHQPRNAIWDTMCSSTSACVGPSSVCTRAPTWCAWSNSSSNSISSVVLFPYSV